MKSLKHANWWCSKTPDRIVTDAGTHLLTRAHIYTHILTLLIIIVLLCAIVIVALVLPAALQRRHTAVHARSFLSVDAEAQAFTSSNGH